MHLNISTFALAVLMAGTAHAGNDFRMPIPGLIVGTATAGPGGPVTPEPPATPVIGDLVLSGPLDFGQVFAESSSSLALTLTNPASNPSVTVGALTPNNLAFQVDAACVTTLAPGQQCIALVTFAPLQTNTYNASLAVTFAGNRTVSTALQGTARANVVSINNARQWSDGSLASSCNAYRNPTSSYVYQGATGDGVYRITPEGGPAQNVYCDMTTDGGGWTLVARWTNYGPEIDPVPLRQGSVMVRGTALAGWSDEPAARPVFAGINRFADMRLDSGNAVWNTIYGTAPTAGLKFPTWGSWPAITSAAQFRVNATNLNGPTVPATAEVSLVSAGWYPELPDSTQSDAWAFGLLTTDSNLGLCGGHTIVGTQNICPVASRVFLASNFHWDGESQKHLWGR